LIDTRDSASPFGVLTFLPWRHDWNRFHYPNDASIERATDLMKNAGVGFARMDFLWADVEPEKGRFDFAHLDRIVDITTKQGVRVLGALHYNPHWRKVPWSTAPDSDAYVLYARAVVRHFKNHVKYWEIWNEPDHPTYWTPQDGMTAYSQLLCAVYKAIKEVDPTSTVLTGGLSDSSAHLRELYTKAGKDCFDIVNLHPFVNPLDPHALDDLRTTHQRACEVMAEFGDGDKPIWFTELGCPGVDQTEGRSGWWLGVTPSEAQQAAWVDTVYRNALTWKGVAKIFWAFFRDTDQHFQNDVDHFGLIRQDFSPKPAYQTYQKLARNGHKP
jgi:hypothetical protein